MGAEDESEYGHHTPMKHWKIYSWIGVTLAVGVLGWSLHSFVERPGQSGNTSTIRGPKSAGPPALWATQVEPYIGDSNTLAVPAGADLTNKQDRYLTGAWPPIIDDQRVERELFDHAHAAPVEQTTLSIGLRSAPGRRVQIFGILPIDVVRAPAHAGTLLYLDRPSDEVPLSNINLLLDFGEAHPIARLPQSQDRTQNTLPAYFPSHNITMNGPPVGRDLRTRQGRDHYDKSLIIRSIISKGSVTFRIRIDYRTNGYVQHTVIDDRGHPFHLTAVNCVGVGYASYQRAHTASFGGSGINPPLVADPQHMQFSYC